MIHQLKTQSEYFEAVLSGEKTFEVRQNDRDFHVGDFLALNELTKQCTSEREHFLTGRCCLVEVTYVLTDKNFVLPGFAVLGIKPCSIGKASECCMHTNDIWKVPAYNEAEVR